MANKGTEESVLFKTNVSIVKLKDGKCMKKTAETKNGKTKMVEEYVDCETALEGEQNANEDCFKQGNNDFDKTMREKLKEINKNFSPGSKKNVATKEETYSDGSDKVVKVTRESSSIEETKKTEKVPDGTKRTLKITRESFLEETKKSVGPAEPEETSESVKILDESFAEESKENGSEAEKESVKTTSVSEEKKDTSEKEDDDEDNDDEVEEINKDTDKNNMKKMIEEGRYPEESMRVVDPEDGLIKKIIKSVFKAMFYPLYKIGIL